MPAHTRDPVRTSLVAFRYEDEWNVGLVGPVIFAFAGRLLSPDDPETAYAEYQVWHEGEEVDSLDDSAVR